MSSKDVEIGENDQKKLMTISGVKMTGILGQNNSGRRSNINISLVKNSRQGFRDIEDVAAIGKDLTKN
jgi:hypothetical protein